MRGFYSLIQYCPDMSRLEAVNVGVLLSCPELDFVDVYTASDNSRVRTLFKAANVTALDAAKESLAARVRVDRVELISLEGLKRFADTRANELRLTEPRPVRVTDPGQDLARLAEELVGRAARQPSTRRVRIPELDEFFDRLIREKRASANVPTEVPVTGQRITVAYAFENGKPQLVQMQRVPQDFQRAIRSAEHLAVQGRLLRSIDNKQLNVVPHFEGNGSGTADLDATLRGLYDAHDVHYVKKGGLKEFLAQVDAAAHIGG